MRFKYNEREFEVPPGVNIHVEVDDEHVDFNFVVGDDWDDPVAMFGGTLEDGSPAPTWADIGIRELT